MKIIGLNASPKGKDNNTLRPLVLPMPAPKC